MTFLEMLLEEVTFIGSRAKCVLGKKNISSEDPSVILYHGYIFNSFYMTDLTAYLDKEGFSPLTANYSFWKDLRETVAKESEKLDDLCQKKGDKVSLIGHSQGGLVATALAQDNPKHVDKVIALGTPFKGTEAATKLVKRVTALGKRLNETRAAYLEEHLVSCRQMMPGSSYLEELHQKGFPKEVEFYSVLSSHDRLIKPWKSALLPESENVKNIIVGDKGHTSLINSYKMIGGILKGE